MDLFASDTVRTLADIIWWESIDRVQRSWELMIFGAETKKTLNDPLDSLKVVAWLYPCLNQYKFT